MDALFRLYCRDNRRGRTNGDLDLYALFAEIDWPEGYYYCMHHEHDTRLLHRDLLRLPRNGRRYREGRWRSRGYSSTRRPASPGRYLMERHECPIAQTSIYRGVHWDRGKGKYRAEIEVRTRRYKLGWWYEDRDAALAYDVACERLGVPERRNFGAHPAYDELSLLRSRMSVCPTCRGACQTGGEFHPPGVAGSHGRFVRLGRWRECETCAGAGYLVDGRPVPSSPGSDALSLLTTGGVNESKEERATAG